MAKAVCQKYLFVGGDIEDLTQISTGWGCVRRIRIGNIIGRLEICQLQRALIRRGARSVFLSECIDCGEN